MYPVDVSIVVCTYCREEMMRDALESLLAQETDGMFTFEIVVVYSGYPEHFDAKLKQMAEGTGIEVQAIDEPRPGQVIARNTGLAAARGEWIANFDDDQLAEPYWLKELYALAKEKNCRSVGGQLLLKLPDGCDRELTPVCRRMLGETVDWNQPQPYTRKQGPGSGNQMLHRSIFDELGRYDESFTLRGYDTDMYRRIREAGIESWYTPKARAYHVTPPDRLEDEYFKETALHNGWSFARRDFKERGVLYLGAVAAARIGQAATTNMLRLWKARLFGSREDVLDARIRLWRAQGYLRSALYAVAPGVFGQERFFSRYEFRAEQKMAALQATRENEADTSSARELQFEEAG